MEINKVPNRIHPLVAAAAVSVTLVSLAGVAAITGLLPSSHSTDAPVAPLASTAAMTAAPAASATSAPATATPLAAAPAASATATGDAKTAADAADASGRSTKKPAVHHSTHVAQTHRSQPRTSYSSGTNTVAQANICASCGRIESIQAVQHQAKPSGLGIAAGAVLGGVLGNQVGNGNGRTLATIAGAVGGGYAGNEVEKRTHTTTTYQVRVRMEDGSVRTIPYSTQPGWNEGDRVRVVNGALEARG